MSSWYYVKDDQKQGPLETADLKKLFSDGVIPTTSLIWTTGMNDWAPANTVPEFAGSVLKQPSTSEPPSVPGGSNSIDLADAEKNKVMGILAYLGILFVVPLVAARESRFAMYHTNQGIVLFIACVGLLVASSIVAAIPVVGWIFSLFVTPFLSLGMLIFMILGIINAAQGVCKPLPVIGHFTIIK